MKHANIKQQHTHTRKPLPSSKPLANPTSPRHSNVRSHCDLHSATARIPRAVVASGSTPQLKKKSQLFLGNQNGNWKQKTDGSSGEYGCQFQKKTRHSDMSIFSLPEKNGVQEDMPFQASAEAPSTSPVRQCSQ